MLPKKNVGLQALLFIHTKNFSNPDSLLSARPRRTHPHTRHHIDTLCNPPSRRYRLSHVYRDAPCFADPETLLHLQPSAWPTVGSVASILVSPDARAPFFPHRFARNSNIVHSSLLVAFSGHHLTASITSLMFTRPPS